MSNLTPNANDATKVSYADMDADLNLMQDEILQQSLKVIDANQPATFATSNEFANGSGCPLDPYFVERLSAEAQNHCYRGVGFVVKQNNQGIISINTLLHLNGELQENADLHLDRLIAKALELSRFAAKVSAPYYDTSRPECLKSAAIAISQELCRDSLALVELVGLTDTKIEAYKSDNDRYLDGVLNYDFWFPMIEQAISIKKACATDSLYEIAEQFKLGVIDHDNLDYLNLNIKPLKH